MASHHFLCYTPWDAIYSCRERESVTDMQRYEVQVWKTDARIAEVGAADYKESFDTDTPAEAAKKLIEAKQVSGKFYIEVRLEGNKCDCWQFTDASPELNS